MEVEPLGGVGVPVQLPEPAGLQGDHGRRNGRGDGERLGVDDAQRASVPGHVLERVLLGVVDVRGVARQQPVASRDFLGRERRVENVRVRRGDAAEYVLGNVEVLGKDGLGSVGDPIVDVERGAGTGISISISFQQWLRTRRHRSCPRQRPEETRYHHRDLRYKLALSFMRPRY